MIQRIVILGTGTGVGKTWLACALATAAARPRLALKPIETGCEPGAAASDAARLRQAAGSGPGEPLYRFADPVTPWLAAERAGTSVDLEAVKRWVLNQEEQHLAPHYTTCSVLMSIIESAGGVFSPLSSVATNLDLSQALAPALRVLVAPNRLGVLHDVGCALRAMLQLGQQPHLVVLNNLGVPDASSDSNLELLRRLHPTLHLMELGHEEPTSAAGLLQHLDALVH